jgi:hypothetical protein
MAQSGHPNTLNQCLLLGVKRTLPKRPLMSAFDPKRDIRSWDPVPIVNARNAQNVLAFHAWANDADLECQNPGKEEYQEVVRYGEGQIPRREIKHRRYSVGASE